MSDAVIVALVAGGVSLITGAGSFLASYIFNHRSKDKKKLDKMAVQMDDMCKWKDDIGDIVYQMLDHMSTNNNTGNMKRCLDTYNALGRHN